MRCYPTADHGQAKTAAQHAPRSARRARVREPVCIPHSQGSVLLLRRDYRQQVGRLRSTLDGCALNYRWPRSDKAQLHYECLYAAGGGTVGATGSFHEAHLSISNDDYCMATFDWYFANVRPNSRSLRQS
jgi:hypothetical protein